MSVSTSDPTTRRIALVTYGTTPIGRAIVLALARHGISSVFTHDAEPITHGGTAAALAAEVESTYPGVLCTGLGKGSNSAEMDTFIAALTDVLAAKFTSPDAGTNATSDSATSTDATAAQIPASASASASVKLHYLVNVAACGSHPPFPILTADPTDLDPIYTSTFRDVWALTSRVLPLMQDRHGVIVSLSSGLARYTNGDFAAYASLKGALGVWTKYLANEVGVRGIRAVAVAPGFISTEDGELEKEIANVTALRRVGTPDDVGRAVAALVGEDMGWVNGTTVEVSGGQQI